MFLLFLSVLALCKDSKEVSSEPSAIENKKWVKKSNHLDQNPTKKTENTKKLDENKIKSDANAEKLPSSLNIPTKSPFPTETPQYKIKFEKHYHGVNKYKKQKMFSIPTPSICVTPSPKPTATVDPLKGLKILHNRPKRDINDIDAYDYPSPSRSFAASPHPTRSVAPTQTFTPIRTMKSGESHQNVKFVGLSDEHGVQPARKIVEGGPAQNNLDKIDAEEYENENGEKKVKEDKFKMGNKRNNEKTPTVVAKKTKSEEENAINDILVISKETQKESKCHRSAIFKDGECFCVNGLVGDGVTSCDFPLVDVVNVQPKKMSGIWETKVLVDFKNTSFVPQGAYCLIGNTVIKGVILSENRISCVVPPIKKGNNKLCLSFDGKNCGKSFRIEFEPRSVSIGKITVIFMLVLFSCLLCVIFIFVKRNNFLKSVKEKKSKQRKLKQQKIAEEKKIIVPKKRKIIMKKKNVVKDNEFPQQDTNLLVDPL